MHILCGMHVLYSHLKWYSYWLRLLAQATGYLMIIMGNACTSIIKITWKQLTLLCIYMVNQSEVILECLIGMRSFPWLNLLHHNVHVYIQHTCTACISSYVRIPIIIILIYHVCWIIITYYSTTAPIRTTSIYIKAGMFSSYHRFPRNQLAITASFNEHDPPASELSPPLPSLPSSVMCY